MNHLVFLRDAQHLEGGLVFLQYRENGIRRAIGEEELFTGLKDVKYNWVFFNAVADGRTKAQAKSLAQGATWVPNVQVVDVHPIGLVLERNRVLEWNKAQQVPLSVDDKEGILAKLRNVYRAATTSRPMIARVGLAIKGE